MMGLYKEARRKSDGGCLPLLLQMPFLFAFYSALAYSIELRRAPWISVGARFISSRLRLWLASRTRPVNDGFNVCTTKNDSYGERRSSASQNDDDHALDVHIHVLVAEQWLVLYWLTGSIIGIAQQVFINKILVSTSGSKTQRSI
jgi:YidC/Oxa1 family membrane protein insertase